MPVCYNLHLFCLFIFVRFLCQYVLEVATVSSTTFLKSTTQVCIDRATHVVYISSAQLNENSPYLKFIGWFSREQPLLQETP